jgi:hypothetical protein
MLVDKRRERGLEKVCTTLGNSCSDKRDCLWQKLLIIIGIQIPVLLLYLQIKTCVEFYRIEELAVQ